MLSICAKTITIRYPTKLQDRGINHYGPGTCHTRHSSQSLLKFLKSILLFTKKVHTFDQIDLDRYFL